MGGIPGLAERALERLEKHPISILMMSAYCEHVGIDDVLADIRKRAASFRGVLWLGKSLLRNLEIT